MGNRCYGVRFLAILTALFLLPLLAVAPAQAVHETIVVDGDLTDLIAAINANLGPDKGGFMTADPLGDIYVNGICEYVNGYDERNVYAFFDFLDTNGDLLQQNVTLYLGWHVQGMIGDVDGDGNPDGLNPGSPGAISGCALSDETGIGPNESYNVLIDVDCVGAVDDFRLAVKDNRVVKIVGGVLTDIAGATFAFQDSLLEVRIPNYLSILPEGTDLCDAVIRMTSNAEFDGLGEDFINPPFKLAVPPQISVTKTPSTDLVCAGSSLDWTIVVKNTGLCTVNLGTVNDTMDVGLTYSSSNPAGTNDGQTVSWQFADLAPGDSLTFILTTDVDDPCASTTLGNRVAVEGAHTSTCLQQPTSVFANAQASVTCRDTPCDISGDLHVCVGNQKTYTTTVGAPFTRAWSVTSTPANICAVNGATDGASVTIDFTGAGQCTLQLTVSDPIDPTNCQAVCTEIITVDPQPPCDISGDLTVCEGDTSTYTTTAGAEYTRTWSVTSTPANICAIDGTNSGGTIDVIFTGAGQCTVSLTVVDPNDPVDCTTTCTEIVNVRPAPPCDISGDLSVCVGNRKNYTTTVPVNVPPAIQSPEDPSGILYNVNWSISSTPANICEIVGPTDGPSVTVDFTGAGQCTVKLTVVDPADQDCMSMCTQIITVNPQPPCDIDGDLAACVGNQKSYTTTVGAEYTREWSVASTPGGICAINGGATGGSVTIDFTGAGACTVSLNVYDPADSADCNTQCSAIVNIAEAPPCDINGDLSVCVGNQKTYYTTAGGGFNKQWTFSSTPGGICNIVGAADGDSVTVDFTGTGQCTLDLVISDPNDPVDCRNTCQQIITVNPQPPCDISGDLHACVGNQKTYTTTVPIAPTATTDWSGGLEGTNPIAYAVTWSVTSTPGGICNTVGGVNGSSVTVDFTGAGTCTLKLTVVDINDPEDCMSMCTEIVTVDPQPPCDIAGDLAVCVGDTATYTTTAPGSYSRDWSVTSNPANICEVVGATSGGSVDVTFTGAGQCTVSLAVYDTADSADCNTTCTQIINVRPEPPCDITGDLHTCVGNIETYTTTVPVATPIAATTLRGGLKKGGAAAPAGDDYNVVWSVTSTPANICELVGANGGPEIGVLFTGAGQCTVKLTVIDLIEPDCMRMCTQIVTIDPVPPCDIEGPIEACTTETHNYSTTAGAEYAKAWSVVSTPANICTINGATDGDAISVDFTAAGVCTVMLTVYDAADSADCTTSCQQIVTVEECGGFACPHTIGFWRQQCAQKGNGSTKVCLAGMENLWRCVIEETNVTHWHKNDGSEVTTAALAALSDNDLFEALCEELKGPRPMSIQHMTEIQYLGFMLNICSGALPLNISINGIGTVADAKAGIENALNTHTDLNYWKTVADNINNRIGVNAEDCPEGDDLFRNLPPCSEVVDDALETVPADLDLTLLQTRPYPNPISQGVVSIFYNVPVGSGDSNVDMVVFDVTGRVVKHLVTGVRSEGNYTIDWDLDDDQGTRVTSGIYFYRLQVGGQQTTQKIMVLRN